MYVYLNNKVSKSNRNSNLVQTQVNIFFKKQISHVSGILMYVNSTKGPETWNISF